MRLLHNMSAPPRSHVVVAPGIQPQKSRFLWTTDWLPKDGSSFLVRLCREAGLGAPADPIQRLVEETEALLVRIHAPAAAVLSSGTSTRPCADRLLALAVLSRSSDRLFLRARTPRFDHASLARSIAISDPAFFQEQP